MTSDEVLGKELKDDMLDVAHVDPVDDTSGRLAGRLSEATGHDRHEIKHIRHNPKCHQV